MDIGNLEHSRKWQHQKGLVQNWCLKFHQVGCRPCKKTWKINENKGNKGDNRMMASDSRMMANRLFAIHNILLNASDTETSWTTRIDENSDEINNECEQMFQWAVWNYCEYHRSEIFKVQGKVRILEAESSGIIYNYEDRIPTDVLIPVEPLLLLDDRLLGIAVTVLNDDVCNTHVVSIGLLKRKRNLFEIRCEIFIACNLEKVITEYVSKIIVHGATRLHDHTYISNLANCQTIYGVLFGIPWYVAHNPNVDYQLRNLILKNFSVKFDW